MRIPDDKGKAHTEGAIFARVTVVGVGVGALFGRVFGGIEGVIIGVFPGGIDGAMVGGLVASWIFRHETGGG